ncbi:flippase [Pedobacter hartonius]|uniref:Membrane protein involved in the export of O-antigen and teichoic acid n=1 Tax=Pedobacter hartonius TaxID=425514 RepID=A0A1H4FVI0_9SPHI|nr:flippase [Pedobacter hartonius]SEB01315.1 Membrane protein involved in the export of O-antigen and teichoic acid [Pedobacter hartonius]
MKIPLLNGFDEVAFEKYFKNTSWLMFGKLLSMVVSFVIAKYLQPASFGDLSFADAFTAILAAIGTLGLDSFIIREIINEPNKRDEILGTSLLMRLGTNLLLVPITVGIFVLFYHDAKKPVDALTWMILILSLVSFFKSFNVIDSYFQSQVQSKFVVYIQNICIIISAVVKILLVVFKLPLIYFAGSLTFDSFILAIGLIFMYQRQGFRLANLTFNTSRAYQLLKKSSPLILSAIMISIYMKIDQVMLKNVGSVEVGIYSAAARLSEAWYFIPVAIVTSVFPAIIQARKTDLERYKKRIRNLYDLLVFISLPGALAVSFCGTFIIQLLYGNMYEGAGPMLSVHIWSGIFVFLGSASSQYLLAEGFTMISFQRTAMGAIVNILLNLYLIPKYGGMGASFATLIACFVSTFYLLLIPRTRQQGILMLESILLLTLIQKIYILINSNRNNDVK